MKPATTTAALLCSLRQDAEADDYHRQAQADAKVDHDRCGVRLSGIAVVLRAAVVAANGVNDHRPKQSAPPGPIEALRVARATALRTISPDPATAPPAFAL